MNVKLFAAVVAVAVSAPALAQVRVEVGLPAVRWEAAPPLVEVEPGVQVVGNYGEEVFFSDGWYWHRYNGHWFRSRDHLGHWAVVEDRAVPRKIYGYPPGRYRNWHGPIRAEERHEQREINHEQREINKERHEERKEEHREERR